MSGTSSGLSSAPAPPSGSCNLLNRLTGSYTCTASGAPFDCSGNQLPQGPSALRNDAENRQTQDYDTVTGNYTCYMYDWMGERVTKTALVRAPALQHRAPSLHGHSQFNMHFSQAPAKGDISTLP